MSPDVERIIMRRRNDIDRAPDDVSKVYKKGLCYWCLTPYITILFMVCSLCCGRMEVQVVEGEGWRVEGAQVVVAAAKLNPLYDLTFASWLIRGFCSGYPRALTDALWFIGGFCFGYPQALTSALWLISAVP
jgi:hypothetical protein